MEPDPRRSIIHARFGCRPRQGCWRICDSGNEQSTCRCGVVPSFMPVTLSLSDGRCYLLQADYEGGTLSNGRLNEVACEGQPKFDERVLPSPPAGRLLRLIGSSWGYAAWVDDRAKTTIITAPGTTTFQPLFTAQMTSSAVMAMNSPDSPGGNITLVGRIHGRLTVVTLEVGY
jgi:hypothetical protein